MTCLRQIILFSLRTYGNDKKRASDLFSKFQFSILYPEIRRPIDRSDKEYNRLLKQHEARIKKYPISCRADFLLFVLEKLVSDTIPEATMRLPGKDQRITYREIALILQKINILVLNDRAQKRDDGYVVDRHHFTRIMNSYFLGDSSSRLKVPKAPKSSPTDSYNDGFTAGYLLGFQAAQKNEEERRNKKKKRNDFPDQYKKKTGRVINSDKFARITNLLEEFEFIKKKYVKSTKNENCETVWYQAAHACKLPFSGRSVGL